MPVLTPIRLVLVDEYTLVREGLASLLRQAAEVTVVAQAASLEQGIAALLQHNAELLLLGHPAEGMSASDAAHSFARATTAATPPPALLVLSAIASTAEIDTLLLAGARGVLSANAGVKELLDAVRRAGRGEMPRPDFGAGATGAASHSPAAERTALQRLTDRERDVFLSTARGYSAPEIAARLNISAKTVDTYKLRIHEKLGVHHRSEYVQFALRARLLSEPDST
jgi:two-component system, NarL family, response regulator NreC